MGLVLAAVTFAEVMKWIGYILIALLCLMFMIVVHEFGHFVVGRLLGFLLGEWFVLKLTNLLLVSDLPF